MRVDVPVTVPVTARRAAAAGATLLAVAGSIGLFVATGGAAPVIGYVSEAGVAEAPQAALYRLSIFSVAAAIALLALALRALSVPAAALLAAAAGCVVASGSVRCSARCPLPPYETPTLADLTHAAASIAGLLLVSAAMLVLARRGAARAVRLLSVTGTAVAVPLQAAAGLSLLLAGRGAVTGVLERVALVATLGWLIAVSAVRAARGGR